MATVWLSTSFKISSFCVHQKKDETFGLEQHEGEVNDSKLFIFVMNFPSNRLNSNGYGFVFNKEERMNTFFLRRLTWANLDARCPKTVFPVRVGSELVSVGVVEHEPWTCVLTCPLILEVLTGLQNTQTTFPMSALV